MTVALAVDAVTDALTLTGPTMTESATATVDTVAPTVTSLALTSSTRAAATYTASFSEAVTGVTAAKLTLGGTSTGWTVSSVTGSGAGPYVFTLANATAGGAPAGTLIPTLALGAGSDPAGNQSVRLIGTSTPFGVPVNTVAPVVSGTLRGANTLTTTTGTWPQAPTSTYAYQWQVSTDGSTGWTSATGDGNATSSYKVAAVDVGRYVRVAVTATNAYGSATGYSSSAAASAYILPSLVGGLAQKGGKVGALLSGFEAAVGELLSAVLDNQSGLIQQPAGIFGGGRGEGRERVSGTRHG